MAKPRLERLTPSLASSVFLRKYTPGWAPGVFYGVGHMPYLGSDSLVFQLLSVGFHPQAPVLLQRRWLNLIAFPRLGKVLLVSWCWESLGSLIERYCCREG